MDKEFKLQFLNEQIALREERINSLDSKKADYNALKEELEKLEKEISALETNRAKDENEVVELKLWKQKIEEE